MADGLIKKAKLISDVRKYTPETESNDFVGITAGFPCQVACIIISGSD